MSMFPALDWLSRRRAGESAALIAHRAGVHVETVRRATREYGPFPRPTQRLGVTDLVLEVADERQQRWVEARRRGLTVKEISQAEGVKHQVVSRVTIDHGPFPALDVVECWVDARRAGQSLAEVAEAAGVQVGVVRTATAPYGPFHVAKGPRTPDGVETVRSIARKAGVSGRTAFQWNRQGRLPSPDFVTARGRNLWLPTTIDDWLVSDRGPSSTCSTCGARCWSVSRHVAHAHGKHSDVEKPDRRAK